MKEKELDIVIVCYNCGKDIVSVLSDLKSGSLPISSLAIHVVDNNSTDDSVRRLKELTDIDINLIESQQNVGFGAGCNLAIPYLKAPKTLLLNPDVHLNSESIKNLIGFSEENPKALIWGGQTVDLNGQLDGKNAWKEPTLIGLLSWAFFGDIILKKLGRSIPNAYSSHELEALPSVDAISGCFFLIDTALFRELKGFDERFFMYSEEVDLCRRARSLGAKPQTTGKAVIIHVGSKTIASLNKLNFLYHSKLKYAKKHWPISHFYVARASIFLGSIIRLFAFAFLSLFKLDKRKDTGVWYSFVKLQLTWGF